MSVVPAAATEEAMAATMSRRLATGINEFPSNKAINAVGDPASSGKIAAVHNSVATGAEPEQVVDQVSMLVYCQATGPASLRLFTSTVLSCH